VAQDFWASSGYRLLAREGGRLQLTDAWLVHLLEREELLPPTDAGRRERRLHARLLEAPRSAVPATEIASLEDADARENWAHFVAFRDRLLAEGSIEDAYAALFRGDVGVAPVFVDLLARVIVRDLLEGEADAWLARAGELFFRLQRVSTEDSRVLIADAATIGMYAESGGFGNVGRLLREQGTRLAQVRMDVLNEENAPFYFLRDELYSFVLDATPGTRGADALARVLERWIARIAGVRVAITPVERVDDERWRWHVGLDAESTAILNALYRGEAVDAAVRERLLLLFRLEFTDPADAAESVRGRPVYLGLACRDDRTLRLKPQNLISNLPVSGSGAGALR
jgi:hypothetical protein